MEENEIEILVRAYFDRLLNKRDLSICDVLLATDYVDHDAPPDTPPGPEAAKQYVQEFLEMYPNLKVQVNDVVVEGHKAAAQITWSGTNYKTGYKLRQIGNIIIHLNEEGQFLERWSVYKSIG